MDRTTIATAIHELEELLLALDDAYWEASSIPDKDKFYDLISICHGELNELAKLSVEVHYMAFEPITGQFRKSTVKLKDLHSQLPTKIFHQRTAEK